jgi:hypothetical protein
MKRLHMHMLVENHSGLFATPPCCGGASSAYWRVDQYGTGENEARVAHAKACCVPQPSAAPVAASACCK